MRLFRATRSDPPTPDDFRSYWDLRKRPSKPTDEQTFKAVSTFTTFEEAVTKARRYDLGDFIAELEVTETVETTVKRLHADLHGTTPEQLLGYVKSTRPRE